MDVLVGTRHGGREISEHERMGRNTVCEAWIGTGPKHGMISRIIAWRLGRTTVWERGKDQSMKGWKGIQSEAWNDE
jgi:hypothetical protein